MGLLAQDSRGWLPQEIQGSLDRSWLCPTSRLDYGENFSPIIKPAMIRAVFTLACSRNWPVNQLDVKNASLSGILDEQVVFYQPASFVDDH
jgi:hypothetical protein